MTAVPRELPSRRISNTLRVFILSPIVLLLGSAIRLLIVSNYDPSTAGAIASLGGVAGTLLGTLVPLIPPFFPVMAFFLYVLRMWKSLFAAFIGMAVVVPAYMGILEAIYQGWDAVVNLWDLLTVPEKRATLWPSLKPALVFAALVIAIIIFDHFKPWRTQLLADFSEVDQWRHRRERSGAAETSEEGEGPGGEGQEEGPLTKGSLLFLNTIFVCLTIVVTTVPAIFVFTFMTRMYHVPYSYATIKEVVRKPWLPLEVIETKNVRYVGYSIATKEGWHAILRDNDRTIRYIPSVEVLRREVCKKSTEPLSQPKPLVDFSETTVSVWRSCPQASP